MSDQFTSPQSEPSIVLELQRDALNAQVAISDLLRKAMVVARKLNVQEMSLWTRKELLGYDDGDELPSTGKVPGHPKATMQGRTQPFGMEDPEQDRLIRTVRLRQPIGELQNFADDSENGTLTLPLPPAMGAVFNRVFGYQADYRIDFSQASVAGAIDVVHNTVLEWSLRLEEQGIMGDGMTFSSEEKSRAQSATATVSYVTNIGSMTNSAVQQAGHHAHQHHEAPSAEPGRSPGLRAATQIGARNRDKRFTA